MAEETIQEVILGEVRRVRDTQDYQGKQLSEIKLQLGTMENDMKTLSNRVNGLNGCTGELAEEVDELVNIESKRTEKKRTRKDIVLFMCKVTVAICAVAGLVIAIVF